MILDALARLLEEHPDRARPGSGWPCCELVARVVLGAAGVPLVGDWYPGRVGGPPAGPRWADAMILDAARPWSSTQAYVDAGLAAAVDAPQPGHWHVAQGWRSLTGGRVGPGDAGHTWLWYALDEERGYALESSERYGVRLGGQRPHLGEAPRVEIWSDRAAPYRAGVNVAMLRVPS